MKKEYADYISILESFIHERPLNLSVDTNWEEILGFVRHTDWEPVYSYIRGAEYYEVHTEVMEIDVSEKMDYREYYSHIWEKAVNVRNHTYEFSPEDHLIYILTHIAKHINGSGAGIPA